MQIRDKNVTSAYLRGKPVNGLYRNEKADLLAEWYQSSSALISSELPKYWADYSNDRYAVNGTPETFTDVTTYSRA